MCKRSLVFWLGKSSYRRRQGSGRGWIEGCDEGLFLLERDSFLRHELEPGAGAGTARVFNRSLNCMQQTHQNDDSPKYCRSKSPRTMIEPTSSNHQLNHVPGPAERRRRARRGDRLGPLTDPLLTVAAAVVVQRPRFCSEHQANPSRGQMRVKSLLTCAPTLWCSDTCCEPPAWIPQPRIAQGLGAQLSVRSALHI